MADPKPLPCPFCGSERLDNPENEWFEDEWFVVCLSCHARGPGCVTQEAANKAWNAAPREKEAKCPKE
jgi:hypothetical protein